MSALLARLRKELGDRLDTRPETLAAHRHDAWMLAQLLDLEGRGAPEPMAVVHAASTDDVALTLRLCRELRVPVVTFGGGSVEPDQRTDEQAEAARALAGSGERLVIADASRN